ncbi:hypothetical protein [Clavibacter zhangzhiyongii]|uniref:hypothetical protein n=1 Tax=Clavibacter zhangzhiyongii TaxID=2768071 RepID=UPI0039E1CB28
MTQLDDDQKVHLRNVFNSLPEERRRAYLEASNRNPFEALELYDENSKRSTALFETIGHFEVHLRNQIDTALAERHSFKRRPGDWLDNNHGELSERAGDAIAKAREDARKNRQGGRGSHPSGRGHIIAELNLSFWRRLLDARYEAVHGSAVMRFYPNLRAVGRNNGDMAPLRDLVEPIYALRNRIAHHEPIWRINARQRRDDMISVIEHNGADLALWVSLKCQLETTFRQP